jgi:cysteine-rich repeat protein
MSRAILLGLSWVVIVGCIEPTSPRCGDLVCAVGQVCGPDETRCVFREQLIECEGLADLAPCNFGGAGTAVCYSGVCTRYGCGNGTLEAGEACDDGNAMSGDGCSADCSSNETCGNGIRDNAEACDDGNTASGDGCQANCALPTCGDGALDTGEACDDGNHVHGDGCNAQCMLLPLPLGLHTTGVVVLRLQLIVSLLPEPTL